jgi:hypothetical protein
MLTDRLTEDSRTAVFRKLNFAYHDALLETCQVGPQREVILRIRLDPVWNPTAPREVTVRFGAIQNFDAVRAFFDRLIRSAERDVLDEIVGIVPSGKGQWTIDLARAGAVKILTPKIPQEQ